MTEFIHRLRNILLKLSSSYDKRVTIALSSPMKRWNSTIAEATMKKNGIKKSRFKYKNNSSIIFDAENYCCLKCRFRTAWMESFRGHIYINSI